MNAQIFNHSGKRIISQSFIQKWMRLIGKELTSRKIKIGSKNINIVFVTEKEMKKINYQFRKMKKVTDVLSFSNLSFKEFSHSTKDVLGELILCAPYIQKKAKKRGVLVREETAYLLLHGFLHLLGYDHEKSLQAAKRMYHLQDQIFDKLYK